MCILFVDDEPVIVMLAEDALHDAGHDVLTANHAPGAIELIAKHPDHFTCLVTDLNMPGELDGTHLVEHMRERYPVIPIVLASAQAGLSEPAWREQHQVELLDKPYTLCRLVGTVARLLGRGSPRRQSPIIGAAGEAAREAQVPRWQNPYRVGTPEHDLWAAGWDGVDDLAD